VFRLNSKCTIRETHLGNVYAFFNSQAQSLYDLELLKEENEKAFHLKDK
jgi:hypothetical protein